MKKLASTICNRYNKAAESGASTPPPGLTETANRSSGMALKDSGADTPKNQSERTENTNGLTPIGIIAARIVARAKASQE